MPEISRDAAPGDREQHSLCPICGTWVDELDLEEVLRHVDPDHRAPPKN
jgi:hypothetical protein